jgi:hypothetical protein
MILRFTYFVILLLFCQCNNKSTPKVTMFFNPLPEPKEIIIPIKFKKELKIDNGAIDFWYSYRIIDINNGIYFSYMNDIGRRIVTFNLEDTQDVKLYNVPFYDLKRDKMQGNCYINKREKLIYINFFEKKISEYRFDKDSLVLSQTTDINPINTKDYFYMHSNADIIGEGLNKQLILNYGVTDREVLNFIDSSNLILYKSDGQGKKIGFYPDKYKKEKIAEYFTKFKLVNDSECVFTYSLADELYKIDLKTNRIKHKNDFNYTYKYPKFDVKRKTDIGYSRNYLSISGANSAIEVTNNGYIVILKILPSSILEKKKLKQYFVFDDKLKLIYSDTVRQFVRHDFLEKYKNGFLLQSGINDKLLYYEIK